MARKTVLETTYTFNPSTKTVIIPKVIPQERLILITNVSTGQVVYNFSDPTLGSALYLTYVTPGPVWLASTTYGLNTVINYNGNLYYMSTAGTSGTVPPTHTSGAVLATGGTAVYTYLGVAPTFNTEQTYIVLNYNTTGMTSTNKLQVIIDDFNESFTPAETLLDPTNKLRVSQPQSLIDTDFEYGSQVTKWENLGLTNNRPFAPVPQTPVLNVSDVTFAATTRLVTVTLAVSSTITVNTVISSVPTIGYAQYVTNTAHNFQPGQYVLIAGASNAGYNGRFLITSVPTPTTFVVPNLTTAGATFSGGTAIAGVAPAVGTNLPAQALIVQDTLLPAANGVFTIEATPATNTFTYTAKAVNTSASITGSIFDLNKTLVFFSTPYSAAPIPMTGVPAINSLAQTVTTAFPHGLSIGNEISVSNIAGTNPPNGNFTVATVTSPTVFSYYANPTIGIPATLSLGIAAATGTGLVAGFSGTTPVVGYVTYTTSAAHNFSAGQWVNIASASVAGYNGLFQIIQTPTATTFVVANSQTGAATWTGAATVNPMVYVRPQSGFLHRSFDGGVLFASNSISNHVSTIRQTRRYFRYQSGKGMQVSSGTILRPYATVDAITSSSTTVTVKTREQHNLQAGTIIAITGCNETAYNGTFAITGITGLNTFTYTALSVPSATTASGSYAVSVVSWFGSTNRLGMFDAQNGLFFEFDGQQLYAVRRNSVYQLSGKSTVTQGSATVVQTSAEYATAYSRQIKIGDYVAIRGQSYRVTDIASDTSMTISPAYRGVSATNVVVNRTVDQRIAQSEFNIDRLDGTGPSGYNMDLSKMQMFYIDYTWYGAGFVRWGVRGPNGNIVYAHRLANNNFNSEAYMRSGNLPARYETTTTPPITNTTATVGTADTTISVVSTAAFPTPTATVPGILCIRDGSHYEYVNYTGKTATTFTGVTRMQAGSAVGGTVFTAAIGAVTGTVALATGLQVGQRVYGAGSPNAIPDGTWVTAISGTTVTLSQPIGIANPTLIFAPMSAAALAAFTFSATNPISVELFQPTFAPSISHWGTSVIMDGRFDDDKSLIFTYGQTSFTSIGGVVPAIIAVGAPTTTTLLSVATPANIVAGQAITGTNIPVNTIVTTNPLTTTFPITSISNTGSAVTYNTPITAPLAVGQLITVSGATVAGFNGTFTITTVNANVSFVVASTATGASSVATATSNTVVLNQNTSGVVTGNGTFSGATTKALFSIRVAPTVDNGVAGQFGQRELINRMQLILSSLGITTKTAASNMLIRAYLNATPSTYTPWTNAVGNISGTVNSSLAQIADYSTALNTWVYGGEVTGGFFVSSTDRLDLSTVRDLGTSIMGNGSATVNSAIYPDGPDTLTIVVTNLSTTSVDVTGRLGWTEAQA